MKSKSYVSNAVWLIKVGALLGAGGLCCIATAWGAATAKAEFELLPQIAPFVRVQVPTPAQFARGIRSGHPRLLLTAEREKEIRQLLATSAVARGWYQTVKENAAYYGTMPVIAYIPEPPGERPQSVPMLYPAREFVDRVYTLGLVARIDSNQAAFDRLRLELINAIEAWPDWQTGIARYEIAPGVALAYDWFFSRWSEAERVKIRGALLGRALQPYREEFRGFAEPSKLNSGMIRNNINLVCNSGAAFAAMAIIDEHPEVSGEVMSQAFSFLQVGLNGFGKDGAWFEGVSYWGFGVRHVVQLLAGMQSSYGSDFGLISTHRFPGFERTGDFPMYLTSPTGHIFNFADSHANEVFSSAALLWLGHMFQTNAGVSYEEKMVSGDTRGSGSKPKHEIAREVAQRLIYYHPEAARSLGKTLPLDALFPDSGVATMRSSWSESSALFVGIKGGTANGSDGNRHAHLDAGTFIIDALGQRWLSELGSGPYVRAYFRDDRYLFYQARTEAHNTLLLNPETTRGGNQSIQGIAVLSPLSTSADGAHCELDLTSLYPEATRITRRIGLLGARSRVQVDDEVELKRPGTLRWHAFTEAPLVLLGPEARSITLKFEGDREQHRGRRMELTLTEAQGLRFVLEPAAALPGNGVINPERIPKFTRIAISGQGRSVYRISVRFEPFDVP